MELRLENGLLFTSVQVTYKGKIKLIHNVVIDTGAAETIISPDAVEDIGVIAELEDDINSFYGVGGSLHYFFSKKVDGFQFDKYIKENAKIDFGVIDPNGSINGLLGLDFLLDAGVQIDLKNMEFTI